VKALKGFGEDAVHILCGAASKFPLRARFASIKILGELKTESRRAIRCLVSLLKDPNRDIVQSSLFVLYKGSNCWSDDFYSNIINILKHPESFNSGSAVDYRFLSRSALNCLGNLDKRHAETATLILKIADTLPLRIRAHAILTYAKCLKGKDADISKLKTFFESGEDIVRLSAAGALAAMGEEKETHLRILIAGLESDNDDIVSLACGIARHFKSDRHTIAAKLLEAAVKAAERPNSEMVFINALMAIEKLGSAASFLEPRLRELFDKSPNLRRPTVILAIAEVLPIKKGVSYLVSVTRERRKFGQGFLYYLGKYRKEIDPNEFPIKDIYNLSIRHPEWGVREMAVELLEYLREQIGADTLEARNAVDVEGPHDKMYAKIRKALLIVLKNEDKFSSLFSGKYGFKYP
jgi:hypothetical protein